METQLNTSSIPDNFPFTFIVCIIVYYCSVIFDNFFGQNLNILSLSSVSNAVKNPTVGRTNLWLLLTDGFLPSVEAVYLNPQRPSAPPQ